MYFISSLFYLLRLVHIYFNFFVIFWMTQGKHQFYFLHFLSFSFSSLISPFLCFFLNYTGRAQLIFTVSEISCGAIRQCSFRHKMTPQSILEQSVHIQLQWYAARSTAVKKWRPPTKNWWVSCGLIKQNRCNGAVERNLEWIHLQIHLCMHFTSSSVRWVVCVRGSFRLLQNVWIKLEYQLEA
jgi:hypothetical protein